MSSHRASIRWQHSSGSFADKSFSRDHRWLFKGDQTLLASSAPSFSGNPNAVDPEDAFTAALSSCHMLTFLALASVKGFDVAEYSDEAEGILDKNPQGRLSMVKATLRPKVRFAGRQPTAEEYQALHDRAHKGCFIANSVLTEVVVEAELVS